MNGADPRARAAWIAMCDLVFENVRRREAAEAAGVSFGKVRALRRLLAGPLTMGDLAASLAIDAPNATVLVADLEAEGLLERRADPRDRRSRIAQLTAAGRRRAQRAQEVLSEPPAALAGLDADSLSLLVSVLSGMDREPVPRSGSDESELGG